MTDIKTFDALGLDSDLLAAITDLGFETPTPVQAAVIPQVLGNHSDLVALAQTGTGKTAAFGLPILQQTDLGSSEPQTLILCPTRELCMQITRDMTSFRKKKRGLRILAVYGGSSIEAQISSLKRGVHIIVATPGRIHDLLRRKSARLAAVRTVVLDEADEMLNMGFQKDLEAILKHVPDTARTLLFSATMPRQVASIAGKCMRDPGEITIGTRNAGAENVTHICYMVHAKDRYLALKRIADFYPSMYGIVFCRTRVETQQIADKLINDGYNADSLHGDLTQAQRDRVMKKFRIRNLHMLVATDVAARGLDVNDLTHIINYNLPDDLDSYTHRSGRTGRAGKDGISVAIINMREKGKIYRIEKMIDKRFEFRKVPTGSQVCEAQLMALIRRARDVEVDHGQIDKYIPEIENMLSGMSREELIKHFVSLEFNRFLDYYRGTPDLNVPDKRSSERDGRSRRGKSGQKDERKRGAGDSGFTKLFINLGKRDGLSPRTLMDLINEGTPGKTVDIGRISIQGATSVFEVQSGAASKVINCLSRVDYGDRLIRVELAEEGRDRRRGRPDRDDSGRMRRESSGRPRPRTKNRKRKSSGKGPGGKKRKSKRISS